MNLETAIQKRENLMRSSFSVFFQIVILLLVPCLLAVYFGNFLNQKIQTGKGLTFILCLLSISFSWFFIFKIYKKWNQEAEALDAFIKKEKELQHDSNK